MAGFILENEKVAHLPIHTPLSIHGILDVYFAEHGHQIASAEQILVSHQHLKAFFGPNDTPMDISRARINEFIQARREGRIGRASRDATIRRNLQDLIAALRHAVREKRLSRDNLPHIAMPKQPAAKSVWLTIEEAEHLRRVANWVRKYDTYGRMYWAPAEPGYVTRVRLFIEIALHTASRRKAIETLVWTEQVDLVRKMIYLNPPGRIQTTKRRPSLPIADTLMPYLLQAKAQWPNSRYVLGEPGSIRKGFDSVVRRAKLNKKITSHTLRHTWATWAAQSGVPLWEIAGVLGDSIQTVEKNYAHHCPDHLRGAVNFMSKRMAGAL